MNRCNNRLQKYPLKWSYSVSIFLHTAYILKTGGIEIVLTITEAEVEPSSPRKVSSSKFGAFSFSFSHGTLIGLLPVAIATVGCFLQSCCLKSTWPEKKMVANCYKHQLNILPSCKVKFFFPSENGKDTYTQNPKQLILMEYLKQQKYKSTEETTIYF